MRNPLYRVVRMATYCYIGFILGSGFTFNTFRLLFNYESNIIKIMCSAILPATIFYIILISSLYINMTLFKKLYYILFFILGWFEHNFFAFLIYGFLNSFISFPQFFNIILYLTVGTGFFIQGIISEKTTILQKIKLKCPNLKSSVTLAHLTDIHLGAVYGKEFIQKLVSLILSEKVDFVCITGDLIDGNIKMTKEMLEPFKQLKCPIYFVSGNHEDYTWKDEAYQIIDNTNIKRIPNNVISFNNKINLIGIDWDKKQIVIEKLKKLLKKNKKILKNKTNIFLYHGPIFNAKQLEKYDIFLFLCGHLHGGHFFPFTLFQFCRDKFVFEGLYNYNNKHYVYCNSGQGTSGPVVRSFSKSQIGIITLEGKTV